MASEWKQTTLNSVLSFANGRTSPERSDAGLFPVYGSNGIIGYADEANSDEDTIVIGRVGTYCGSLHYSKQKCWVTDNAIRATRKIDNNPRYLHYLLTSLNLNHLRGGSGQPLLNQTTLGAVPVVVPPPKEQQAIACILSALDDKIELNRKTNQTLEEMARAIFQSWFVDFDPVRAKADGKEPPGLAPHIADLFPDSFEESELGEIPKGWKVMTIGEICEVAIGGAWGQDQPFEGAVEVVCLRGVDLEHLRARGGAVPPRRWIKEKSLENRRMDEQDILIAVSGAGPTGRCLWVSQEIETVFDVPVMYSNFCKRFHCRSVPMAVYLDRYLAGMRESGEIWSYVNGTSVPNLDAKSLLTTHKLVIPSDQILRAFLGFVRPVWSRLYSGESRTLAELRDTLLPRLISGELRVPDAERIVGRCI